MKSVVFEKFTKFDCVLVSFLSDERLLIRLLLSVLIDVRQRSEAQIWLLREWRQMRIQFAGISQAWKLCFLLHVLDIWQTL